MPLWLYHVSGYGSTKFIRLQMLSLHCLSQNCCSFSKQQPLMGPQISTIDVFKKINSSSSSSRKQQFSCIVVHAADKESSQQYEIDPDKAKEALDKLDMQLQSFSKKQVSPPKIKASDVKLTRGIDEPTEDVPEISGSALGLTVTGLFLFTIFYNIFFYKVIKPSVDIPVESTQIPFSATTDAVVGESPEATVLQLLPSIPDIFMRR